MQVTNNQNLKYKNPLIVFILFYTTILIGFFFNEDSLGGARVDFIHHYEISLKFSKNFLETFQNFGSFEEGMDTRNSPVFWIFISFLNNFFSEDILRILNSFVSILIGLVFLKCLRVKFESIKLSTLIILSSVIFLSPTIRSLSIWPYTYIWGLFFFIVSIYYFLIFLKENDNNKKFNLSLKSITFVVFSSYIYPSFAIFFLYYYLYYVFYFKISKRLFYITFYSLIFSLPALYYIVEKDVITSFTHAQGISTSLSESLNISNKIIIISTMILFFILPIINLNELVRKLKSIKILPLTIMFIFFVLNIYFFNFPSMKVGGFGGGFFYKLSNLIFENNYLFFFAFLISIITIYLTTFRNWNNYFIYLLLILFNPQLTIYNKYYDPLIYIIFLLLINFDVNKHFFEKKYNYLQLYFLYVAYLIMGLLKPLVGFSKLLY
tara:strand:+ start:1442 stop:2749 length:1308 start_codon:yes stop_codon:yes gene_type:complete